MCDIYGAFTKAEIFYINQLVIFLMPYAIHSRSFTISNSLIYIITTVLYLLKT